MVCCPQRQARRRNTTAPQRNERNERQTTMAATQTAGGRSSTTKGAWSEYENVRAWLLQARKTRRGISDTIAELQQGAAQLAEGVGLGWDHPTVQSYLDDQT